MLTKDILVRCAIEFLLKVVHFLHYLCVNRKLPDAEDCRNDKEEAATPVSATDPAILLGGLFACAESNSGSYKDT